MPGAIVPSDLETLLVDVSDDGHVVTITFNRPAARNAISRQLAAELLIVCDALSEADAVRAVVVTGSGTQAFCAGADLRERHGLTAEERSEHLTLVEGAVEALAALPMPTIAAIHGYALAGGTEIAIACDLRVLSRDAVMGLPEVRVGLFPGAGGAHRLPTIIGMGRAKDLLLTGRHVTADEALSLGLANRVVEADDVMPTAQALAVEIAANAPIAVRLLKQAIHLSTGMDTASARGPVTALRRELDATDDYAEGLRAFSEKRKPTFTGR